MDEQSISSSDSSSSVDPGTRVLSQQSVESMALGGSSVNEGDTSRDSGINEPSSLTGDDPAPTTNQSNALQKNMINSRAKVKILDSFVAIGNYS